MLRLFRTIFLSSAVVAFFVCIGHADEGLFKPFTLQTPFDQASAVRASAALYRTNGAFTNPVPSGSGVVISSDGFILTNFHTIAPCIAQHKKQIGYDGHDGLLECVGYQIQLPLVQNGSVIGHDTFARVYLAANGAMNMAEAESPMASVYDDWNDFALIKVEANNLDFVKLRPSALKPGERVFSLGYPNVSYRDKHKLQTIRGTIVTARTFLSEAQIKLSLVTPAIDGAFRTELASDFYFQGCTPLFGMIPEAKASQPFCGLILKVHLNLPLRSENDADLKDKAIAGIGSVFQNLEKLEREVDSALSHQSAVPYPDADNTLRISEGSVLEKEGYPQTDKTFFSNLDGLPGSSGSPVLDREGYLIGLVSRMHDDGEATAFLQYGNASEYPLIQVNARTLADSLMRWSGSNPSYHVLRDSVLGPTLPLILLRMDEAFNVAKQVQTDLWDETIPYDRFPVLVYDTVSAEEYLVNSAFPPNTQNYELSDFIVNFKRVYKKKSGLTFPVPQLACCQIVEGHATILVGVNKVDRTELLISTLIHEGFHYFQNRSLYKAGVPFFGIQKTLANGMRTYPRQDLANESDLVIEGKLLADLSANQTLNGVAQDQLGILAASEAVRKSRISDASNLFEDFNLLLEGTAFYVEAKAFERLSSFPYFSVIAEGADPQYSHFKSDDLAATFDASKKLRNKLMTQSGLSGLPAYIYGRAMAKAMDLLERSDSSRHWKEGLFLPEDALVGNSESGVTLYLDHVRNNNLFQRLRSTMNLDQATVDSFYKRARSEYLTVAELDQVKSKIDIEQNLDSFPFEDGWTYVVETGEFLYPKLSNPMKLESFGAVDGMSEVFFSGYDSIETANRSIVIPSASIPVVLQYMTGNLRFKDIGHGLSDAKIECVRSSENDVCDSLSLKISGLELQGARVKVTHFTDARKTVIQPYK